jgi:hypothetical protein
MDFNGNKKLDAGEFEQALGAFGYYYKSFLSNNCSQIVPKEG